MSKMIRKITKLLLPVLAVTMMITLMPATKASADIVIGCNGFFYATEMNQGDNKVNLNVSVTGTTAYQWQKSSTKTGTYTDISDATTATVTITAENGMWYRCRLGSAEPYVYTESLRLFNTAIGIDGIINMKVTSDCWYITNGEMAYTVNCLGESVSAAFDILGVYPYDGNNYWMNTSYNTVWNVTTSTSANPSADSSIIDAQLDEIRMYFDPTDDVVVYVELDTREGVKSVAIGTDTMLGSSPAVRYADNASLKAIIDEGTGKFSQVQMVGALSLDDALLTDPAFVFKQITPVSYFWIGGYGQHELGQAYCFNTESNSGNVFSTYNSQDIVTEIQGTDSALAISWTNIEDGDTVKFKFNIGTVAATGAVCAATAATSSTTVTVSDATSDNYYALYDGDRMIREWTNEVTPEHTIVFTGLKPDRQYIVKTILAEDYNPSKRNQDPEKIADTEVRTAIDPTNGGGSDGDPAEVGENGETGGTVKFDPRYNRIIVTGLRSVYTYALYKNGAVVCDYTAPENGKIVFTGLDMGTTYQFKAKSEDYSVSDAVDITTRTATITWRYFTDGAKLQAIKTITYADIDYETEDITVRIKLTDGAASDTYVTIENKDEWDGALLPSLTTKYLDLGDPDAVATTTKPTAAGEYRVIVSMTSGDNSYEITREFVIEEGQVAQDEAPEDALDADAEASYINRRYGYIIYDAREHVLNYAVDENDNKINNNNYLDMTTETITTTMTVACYSTDGGKSWKQSTLEQLNAALPKLLNNICKLRIANAYDAKTKKADSEAVIYSFGTITRRPATTRFTVNYYLCRDDYGLTNGQWCLTKDNRGADMDQYEIGICDDGKSIGSKGYGVWPAGGVWGTCGGVWISDVSSTGKTQKEVYLYRKLAEVNLPSSKPVKITVTSVQAAPTVKVDYKKESIKLKEGMSIYFGATLPEYNDGYFSMKKLGSNPQTYADYEGRAILKFTKNQAKTAINLAPYITETRNTIIIWSGATAKKPATDKQHLKLAARAPIPTGEQCVTISNGIMKFNTKYEVYDASSKKWVASIKKTNKTQEYLVRAKATVKAGKESDTTYATGLVGKLTLTYGVIDEAKKKSGYISAVVTAVDAEE